MRVSFRYDLVVNETSGEVVRASFWATDDEAAGKIARAIVRTWVASTKNYLDPITKNPNPITKEMVRLVPINIISE
jgi:hypothetical protein